MELNDMIRGSAIASATLNAAATGGGVVSATGDSFDRLKLLVENCASNHSPPVYVPKSSTMLWNALSTIPQGQELVSCGPSASSPVCEDFSVFSSLTASPSATTDLFLPPPPPPAQPCHAPCPHHSHQHQQAVLVQRSCSLTVEQVPHSRGSIIDPGLIERKTSSPLATFNDANTLSRRFNLLGRLRSFSASHENGSVPMPTKLPIGAKSGEQQQPEEDPKKIPCQAEPSSNVMQFTRKSLRSINYSRRKTRLRWLSQSNSTETEAPPVLASSSPKQQRSSNIFEELFGAVNILHSRNSSLTGRVQLAADCGSHLVISKSLDESNSPFLKPASRPRLYSTSEENAFVAYFKQASVYEVLPNSSKLIMLDSRLKVSKAIETLLLNDVASAAVWHADSQSIRGIFDVNFACHLLAHVALDQSDEHAQDEDQWTGLTVQDVMQSDRLPWHEKASLRVTQLGPEESLLNLLRALLPGGKNSEAPPQLVTVLDPAQGNVLGLITLERIVSLLRMRLRELPTPCSSGSSTVAELVPRDDEHYFLPSTLNMYEALRRFCEIQSKCALEARMSLPWLPVMRENCSLAGALYAADLLYNFTESEELADSLNELIERKYPICEYQKEYFCYPSDSLIAVLEKMCRLRTTQLLVLEENANRLIAAADILRSLLKLDVQQPASEINLYLARPPQTKITVEAIGCSCCCCNCNLCSCGV